jgi:hypothetical protein
LVHCFDRISVQKYFKVEVLRKIKTKVKKKKKKKERMMM